MSEEKTISPEVAFTIISTLREQIEIQKMRIRKLKQQKQQCEEYERIVTSYNMKPIDYDIACETVNKLLDERKTLKEQNAQLKELLRECKRPVCWYVDIFKNKAGLLIKIDEVLK
jgi:hypothetical protein